MNLVGYTDETWDKVSQLIDGNFILLMTATDLETNHLHKFIKPILGYSAIIKAHQGSQTYYVGKFGHYKIAHVQCGMGSISREGSILTTNDAIKVLKPKFLLMLGIAFGVDDSCQKIGDVLVSEAILPYNSKRVGKKQTIPRAVATAASKTILNRFKNLRTWEHFVNDVQKSELICGHLLSGEELIDNKAYRNKLIKLNPTAKGGEMEGAGIISACDGNVEWIIVKGICDFADGNKGENKETNQTIAIAAAVSVCLEVFSSKTTFDSYGIKSIDELATENRMPSGTKINEILFDLYDERYEQYYILRDSDNEFATELIQYGIWLYGPSGCGKSNLILRNLISLKKQFIQISLANCVGQSVDDFFKEILFELTAKTEGITNQIFPSTYKESHKKIIGLLEKHFPNKELIIFIEEIPIELDSEYKEFTEKMLSLLISKSYSSNILSIKFVLSSINSPIKHIHVFQQKIFQQIKFNELKYWDEKEIQKLVDIICVNFQLVFKSDFKERLIKSSKGSPRFIKKFFRNLFAVAELNDSRLFATLKETERELNLF